MKNFLRIILVVFILIGGTAVFGFWSFQQFDNVFENLGASYVAISTTVYERPTTATTTSVTATSTDSTSIEQATSTSPTSDVPVDTSSDQDDIDPKFKLVFPSNKKGVYIGCTYEISWLASTTIKFLETTLIDAGTRKTVGPVASGLAKENNIEADSQSLKWKVGVVWPGSYLISISKVNAVTIEQISKKFVLNEMPKGATKEQRGNLCEETGGNLL